MYPKSISKMGERRMQLPDLIDRVYEAAVLPDLWGGVLQDIASRIDAAGVCFVYRGPESAGWVISEQMADFADAYMSQGWLSRDDRVPPVFADQYPGFRIDADYRSDVQTHALPIYRDFLLGMGYSASAACALPGVRDDALHIGVEGFSSTCHARASVPFLDRIRPHLARAVSLSARILQARHEASVESLQLAGVGAAIVSPDGRCRASNRWFETSLSHCLSLRAGKMEFLDGGLQRSLKLALSDATRKRINQSFPIGGKDGQAPVVIHLVPLRKTARDVFGWDGVLLLLARPGNASVPEADLLRLLFDLTPAEARLTRCMLNGATLKSAAQSLCIAEATARVHLRQVFMKTGVTRQSELLLLLRGIGHPCPSGPGVDE